MIIMGTTTSHQVLVVKPIMVNQIEGAEELIRYEWHYRILHAQIRRDIPMFELRQLAKTNKQISINIFLICAEFYIFEYFLNISVCPHCGSDALLLCGHRGIMRRGELTGRYCGHCENATSVVRYAVRER